MEISAIIDSKTNKSQENKLAWALGIKDRNPFLVPQCMCHVLFDTHALQLYLMPSSDIALISICHALTSVKISIRTYVIDVYQDQILVLVTEDFIHTQNYITISPDWTSKIWCIRSTECIQGTFFTKQFICNSELYNSLTNWSCHDKENKISYSLPSIYNSADIPFFRISNSS